MEAGALRGVRRAFKHTEHPSDEAIAEAVENAVMGALCEVLEFSDEDPPSNPFVAEG